MAKPSSNKDLINSLSFSVHQLGLLESLNELAMAYQASNVFVSPSIQDSGPMMVAESLACGTPVIAFKMGLADDLIQNGKNGFLCDLYDFRQIGHSLFKISQLSEQQFADMSVHCLSTAHATCSQDFALSAFFQTFQDTHN